MTAPTTQTRDNLLGVCHAMGKTFGLDPLVLRLALMVGLLLDFEGAVIAYLACGLAVLIAALLSRGSVRAPAVSGTALASSCR